MRRLFFVLRCGEEDSMKFAIFYEITVPRKWGPEAEARIFHEVVEQVIPHFQ